MSGWTTTNISQCKNHSRTVIQPICLALMLFFPQREDRNTMAIFNSFYRVGRRRQILVTLPAEFMIFNPLEVSLINIMCFKGLFNMFFINTILFCKKIFILTVNLLQVIWQSKLCVLSHKHCDCRQVVLEQGFNEEF